MRSFQSAALAVEILLALATCHAAENYTFALFQGSQLGSDAAQRIEASVRTNPANVYQHAVLLGYYSAHAAADPAMREARLKQIEWLIANAPTCPVLHEPAARLQPADFAAPHVGYNETLRQAWQQQVDARPNDALVVENAYRSLALLDARENNGQKSVPYLQRLRALDPGDPQWAADLATFYAFALLRGVAPGAPPAVKQLGASVTGDLQKSNDAAVVGYVGIVLYNGARMGPAQPSPERDALLGLGESLLRRAAELNPKNPSWSAALSAPPPKTNAESGARITGAISESDLWPGGQVRELAVPPGAVRISSSQLRLQGAAAAGPKTIADIRPTPPGAAGAGCSIQFDVLVAADGQVLQVQIAGFERLNLPFEESTRDWLRNLTYQSPLVNGKPVEAVARFDEKCPPSTPPAATGVVAGVPGGVVGGVLGGILSGAPPPPPPPRPTAGDSSLVIGRQVMAAQLVTKVDPIYPQVAKNARLQGVVHLSVIIDQEGKVESVDYISGPPLLTSAAIDAVKQWVYKPTRINGQAVRVKTQVEVSFTLDNGH